MDIDARYYQLKLSSPQDALDVVSCIIENQLPGLIFEMEDISPDFFCFSNGIAGDILQKFTNYHARIGIVLPKNHNLGVRVTELAAEHKSHSNVRFFSSRSESAEWLVK